MSTTEDDLIESSAAKEVAFPYDCGEQRYVPKAFLPPTKLSEEGHKAWSVITNILVREGVVHPGCNRQVFEVPSQEEKVLMVAHDGGDHAPFFNIEYQATLSYSEMNRALREAGFCLEAINPMCSVVSKQLPTEIELKLLIDSLGAGSITESEEADDETTKDLDSSFQVSPAHEFDQKILNVLEQLGLHVINYNPDARYSGKCSYFDFFATDEYPWAKTGGSDEINAVRELMRVVGNKVQHATGAVTFTSGYFDSVAGRWRFNIYVHHPVGVKEALGSEAGENDEFRPTSKQAEIHKLFTENGLHLATMIEHPSNPARGALAEPVRVIQSILQPEGDKPWTTHGIAGSELVNFLRQVKSGLGEILDTPSIDYRTRFDQNLGGWKINWLIGSQDESLIQEDQEKEKWQGWGAVKRSYWVEPGMPDDAIAAIKSVARRANRAASKSGCWESSFIWANYLQNEINGKRIKVVSGKVALPHRWLTDEEAATELHVWLEIDGKIFDPTVFQFTGEPDHSVYHKQKVVSEALQENSRSNDSNHVGVVGVFRERKDSGYDCLVAEREDGKWCMAGGHARKGEDIEDAARREMKEETNLELGELTFLKELPPNEKGKIVHVFGAMLPEGDKAKAGDDAERVKWVPLDDLPELAFNNNTLIKELAEKMGLEVEPVTEAKVPAGKVQQIQAYLDELTKHEAYDDQEISLHPDGADCGTCTNAANLVVDKFGGQVLGYYHEDNPTAALGETEGGHDFALIDNRWIVDWWAKNFAGYTKKEIYDLQDPRDAEEIKRLYGDPKTWVKPGQDSAVTESKPPWYDPNAGAQKWTQDVEGAPVKIGQKVTIGEVPRDEEDTAWAARKGQSGTVVYLEYSCGCGQSYPEDPMIGIRFDDGATDEFWKEELVAPVQESVPIDKHLAYLESIKSKMEEGRRKAYEEETNPEEKQSILEGHGPIFGSCGHKIQGCRCSAVHRRIEVDAPCSECALGGQENISENAVTLQQAMALATKELIDDPKATVWRDAGGKRKHFKVKSPYDINCGFCEEWANRVEELVPEAMAVDPGNITGNPDDTLMGHVFILYKGKYYDSETPEGVSDWKQLPLFLKNVQESSKASLLEARFDRLIGEDKATNRYGKDGFLVVFEGIDGAGKTTQVKRLADWLNEQDYSYCTTKWNSSKILSDALWKAKKKKVLNPMSFSLLHASDMHIRYDNIVVPALKKGKVMICDRYYYTSFVRDQIRGIDEDLLKEVYKNFRKPDLIFFCQVSPKVATERLMADRGVGFYSSGQDVGYGTKGIEKTTERYESDMADRYEAIFKDEPNVVRLDTSKSVEEIAKEIKKELSSRLGLSEN